jgi:parallel beta-helix repeat protein
VFRFLLAASVLMTLGSNPASPRVASQERSGFTPDVPILEVTKDVILDPKKTYGRVVVKSSDVVIDGKGAWVIGVDGGNPKTFKGFGVEAKGMSGVTLRNLNIRGFETGLRVENAKKWTIDDCNFSDNFHDPEFGWGENGRRGGIVLINVHGSTIKNCKANRVWDGCILDHSDGNTLSGNDFSRCSNTCLKLWRARRNTITDNKFDYGIRIKPGEVHARDSTCVLIETGSDGNAFLKNSCRYGGDGIFVRSLNGWVSTGNRFEKNDCSFANNNGFECWSPGQHFRGQHGQPLQLRVLDGRFRPDGTRRQRSLVQRRPQGEPQFAASAQQRARRHRVHVRFGHAHRSSRQQVRRQQRCRHCTHRRSG